MTTTKTVTVEKKNQTSKRKSAAPKTVTVTKEVTSSAPAKNKKKNNNKNSKKLLGIKDAFKRHLLMPDIYGAFRIPRFGGAVRTILCYDKTIVTLTGNGTSPIQGFQMQTQYSTNCGLTYAAGSVGGAFTTAGAGLGTQFPDSAKIADVNFVAGCITAVYSGSPLNAAGEMIFGRSISISAASSSYSAMTYYPGTIREQMAYYYDNPLRVSAQKISSSADEFVATNFGNGDVEVPFIFLNTTNTNISVSLEVTRVWEARSTTAAAGVIAYDSEGRSGAADLASYQDAVQENGNSLMGSLSSYVPEGFGKYAGVLSVGSSLVGLISNANAMRVRNNEAHGRLQRERNFDVNI